MSLSQKNKETIDDTDFKLLDLLLEDGRISFKELSQKAGIDERLASRRVEKMIKEGIIQGFTVTLDWSKLGLRTEIWVGTRTGIGQELRDSLFKFFNESPYIVKVDSSVGTYEYVFSAMCRDLNEFRSNIATPLEPYTAGLLSSILTSPIKRLNYRQLLNAVKRDIKLVEKSNLDSPNK